MAGKLLLAQDAKKAGGATVKKYVVDLNEEEKEQLEEF